MKLVLNSKIQISQDIADQYENYIRLGVLQKGEKLPSVRELALILGINPHTVEKAYAILESKGLVKTLFKKGSFVNDLATLDENPLKTEIKKLIDLGFSLEEIKIVVDKMGEEK